MEVKRMPIKAKKMMQTISAKIKQQSGPLLSSAVRSGANAAGKQIKAAASDLEQPSAILLGNIISALKGGALAAGKDLIASGIKLAHGSSKEQSFEDDE
jgi:hypothetical protein